MTADIVKKAIMYSLLLTTILFVVAFTVNLAFDHARMQQVEQGHKTMMLKTESYMLEQQLYEQNERAFCPVLEERLWELEERINEFSTTMNVYRGQTFVLEDEFSTWKRRYIQAQIRFLSLAEYLERECGVDTNIILFFFRLDHEPSITQSFVLQDLREEHAVVVLSFDVDYDDEPALDALLERHNITHEPTIIVPGGETLDIVSYIGEVTPYLR